MTVRELRQRFHYLIDNIEDENLLKGFYEMLYQNYYEKGSEGEDFWEALSNEQKEELLEALKESEKEENLIPHEQVIHKARQWLNE